MNKRLLYIALVVLTSSGSGCMNTSSHGKTINAIQQPDVHATLGAGDVFDIRVFQEPDLSGMYRVDESGRIDYPLVGPVQVAGRLPNDVAAELRSRLRSFVKSPQISVYVRESNSKRVIVYGQVQRPGTFPYAYPMTVSQAISLAGGFATMAAREKVRVFRIEHERQVVIDVNVRSIVEGRDPNQYLFPGDEVYVPDRLF